MFGRYRLSVAILAAATLLLESTLIRLLAIAQFYHFAFLVVSLALLGYGASGTLLTLSPQLRKIPLHKFLIFIGIGFSLSVGIAYGVVTFLPFDSYSIAWDRRQILYFLLYYLVLTLPFMVSGLGIGTTIFHLKGKSHLVYAANLIGSGIGALLAPFSLWLVGVPGTVLLSAVMGLTAGMSLAPQDKRPEKGERVFRIGIRVILGLSAFCGMVVFVVLAGYNSISRAPLGMTISPYKGLAQVQRYADAQKLFSRWNAISRIDVIANAGVHQFPGLSYLYAGDLPPQIGLSVDADSLLPITLSHPRYFEAAAYLPQSIAFVLRPQAEVLVLDPGAGLGVLQALAGNVSHVTAVVENPLIVEAIAKTRKDFNIFEDERVTTVLETSRIFLAADHSRYDVVFIPLVDSFRPVSSGAYSLSEDYSLTVESFTAILDHLHPSGIIVMSRWLQTPPSESLRLAATWIESLEKTGSDAQAALVLYRGIQNMTFLVKPQGWDSSELQTIRDFTTKRRYDLVWMAGVRAEEVNRYNQLPESIYYQAIRDLLALPADKPYAEVSRFDIRPATDDRPFFFHFFKWEQTPEVIASIGHTWQPFGGSGYLVILALLIFVIILSLFLIWFPMLFKKELRESIVGMPWKVLAYFSFLGLAFLFVEIPLIQHWILLLGQPIYSFTVVVFTLLLFSSLGSTIARKNWLPIRIVMILIVALTFLVALALPKMTDAILGWPSVFRVLAAVTFLSPLGVLMGIPFPLGLQILEQSAPDLIPWAWAVNGCASVVASVCAAMFALSYGFMVVLLLGGVMYAGASMIYWYSFKHPENA